MIITIQNDLLTVQISTRGAEMQSITTKDDTEYLWQGDERYWSGRATNLFPFVGRLHEAAYTYNGQRYDMGIHGFLRYQETLPRDRENHRVFMECGADEDTLPQYPFPYRAGVDYRLEGNTLHITYRVLNTGEHTLIFGLGGHPGFNVPLEDGLAFEDYQLRFEGPLHRHLLSENYLMSGETVPFPLEGGVLPLQHNLFDDDAIVLHNPSGSVRLDSPKGKRGVLLRHNQMPYLGLWHKPHTDAPYICLEPWLTLPGRDSVLEDLSTAPGYVHLPPGEVYENHMSIQIFQ